MKKFGIFGAAALIALASCTNDMADAPVNGGVSEGDLYMSMTLRPNVSTGTRTSTPDQGSEEGQDFENKLSSALIVFATNDDKVFSYSLVGETDFTTDEKGYMATFAIDRQTILGDIGEAAEKTYKIYVIGNPSYQIIQNYVKGKDMQYTFNLDADGSTYWANNHFMMSNVSGASKTIKKDEIGAGTHVTPSEAYPLGTVEIQRAMSRIDLSKDNLTFTLGKEDDPASSRAEKYQVQLDFDGVALINQATSQYLFKVVSKGEAESDGVAPTTLKTEFEEFIKKPFIQFGKETNLNFVFSPIQDGFTLPLFGEGDNYYGSKGAATEGILSSKKYDFTKLTYDKISDLNDKDGNFTLNENDKSEVASEYYRWRYCMENTIFDKDNQVHGNSTGIVFRAKMTGAMIEGAGGKAVYAYNNVILGNAEQLQAYATGTESTDDPGVFEIVKILYHDSKENYKSENENQEPTDLAALDKYLVANNFTIYRPDTDGNYYCYYTYWNRHNDNLKNTIMWPMEFATVRNNIYKISLNTILRLGHSNTPDDDPDPEDPGTPDEKDLFYCTVICKVIPWEVRINHVDF